jgi:hypothetical protein
MKSKVICQILQQIFLKSVSRGHITRKSISDENPGASLFNEQTTFGMPAFHQGFAARLLNGRLVCALIFLTVLASVHLIAMTHTVMAGPGSCDPDPVDSSKVICTGDQSGGVASSIDFSSPPTNTLNVNSLSNDIQTSGKAGILFHNNSGDNVIVNSGDSQSSVVITTEGNDAAGIVAESRGTPADPPSDDFLDIPIPGTPEVAGGVVEVNSYSNITTDGNHAHGIVAQSNTSGYPESIITALENFSDTGISFKVTSVLNPDGSEGGIASQVKGHILNLDADGQFDGYAGEGGSFLLNEDGSYSFDPGTDFDALTEGESRVVSVKYLLDGYRNGELKRSDVTSELFATVTKTDTGFEIVTHAYFNDYGESTRPADMAPGIVCRLRAMQVISRPVAPPPTVFWQKAGVKWAEEAEMAAVSGVLEPDLPLRGEMATVVATSRYSSMVRLQ